MKLRMFVSAMAILSLLLIAGNSEPAWAKAKDHHNTIKRLVTLKAVAANDASGIAKTYYRRGTTLLEKPIERLQVVATGLIANAEYRLVIDGQLIDSAPTDRDGAVEFIYSSQVRAGHEQKQQDMRAFPAALKGVGSIKNISINDSKGDIVLTGQFNHTIDDEIKPEFNVPNVTVTAGTITTQQVILDDPNGDPVSLSIKCDKGSFISVLGITITYAPKDSDVGDYNCTLTATDKFNLSTEALFQVTVVPSNQPPTIAAVPDQMVRVGDTKRFIVQANDPNGDILMATLVNNVPAVKSITPSGGNSFTIELSPKSDTEGGRVTVQVTDPGGLSAQVSFNVKVERLVSIVNVSRLKPSLFISGAGYGSSGAIVTINGVDVSARISGQSNTSLTLKGSNRKLNLKKGPNQIIITAGGISSMPFVLTL